MKVLLLTRYSRMGASSRLRSLQYLDALAAAGVEVRACPLLDEHYLKAIYAKRGMPVFHVLRAYLRRLRLLLGARNFDVVWIEKELFPNLPAWFEWLLARARVPCVVDYDDAVFHNYDLSAHPMKRLLKHKIDNVMRHADLVLAGNHYLLRRAVKAGARQVALLPTVVDIARYRSVPVPAPQERLVIGWVGSPSTVRYLRALLPVLTRLAARFPIELAVIGAQLDIQVEAQAGTPASLPFAVKHIRWTEDTEAAEIARFDIGVMPLDDGPWEQGKCGYKLIQYMACGKPVVGSRVGANVDIVEAGASGFLAGNEDEWFEALGRLLADPPLRHAMGYRGRALVEEKYCLQVTAPLLVGHLCEVAARRPERMTVTMGMEP